MLVSALLKNLFISFVCVCGFFSPRWFKQDDNAVPPTFILQPISSLLPDYSSNEKSVRSVAVSQWWEESEMMQESVSQAAKVCFDKNMAHTLVQSGLILCFLFCLLDLYLTCVISNRGAQGDCNGNKKHCSFHLEYNYELNWGNNKDHTSMELLKVVSHIL